MRILMISIGTRGDCEPFLAVGNMLKEHNHEIICAFPEQYRHMAVEEGVEFHTLGNEFLDLLDSEVGRVAMGSSKGGIEKLSATLKLAKLSMPIQMSMIDLQHEIVQKTNPDCLIFHPKVTYPLPWSLKTGKKIVMLSTVPCMIHEIKGYSNVGINKNFGKLLNPLTYKLANFGTAIAIMQAVKKYFKGEFTRKQIQEEMHRMKIFYNVSPSILQRPHYWPSNAIISGHWERLKANNWAPPQDILDFLDKHQKIIFISFGSAMNTDPRGKTSLFLDVLKECNIPAIINISGGGFVEPEHYDKGQVIFTKSIPYDWILPKMYAVVHHGGAGTTHSSIGSACATMAIPHAADQPMWDNFIETLGVGPKGIPISKLKKQILKEKLLDLYNNPSYKICAENISKKRENENLANDLYRFIMQ